MQRSMHATDPDESHGYRIPKVLPKVSMLPKASMLRCATDPAPRLPTLLVSPPHSTSGKFTVGFESPKNSWSIDFSKSEPFEPPAKPQAAACSELQQQHQQTPAAQLTDRLFQWSHCKLKRSTALQEDFQVSLLKRRELSSNFAPEAQPEHFHAQKVEAQCSPMQAAGWKEATKFLEHHHNHLVTKDRKTGGEQVDLSPQPPPSSPSGYTQPPSDRRQLVRDQRESERMKVSQQGRRDALLNDDTRPRSATLARLDLRSTNNSGRFLVGDLVTTLTGIDAKGPWKDMGDGKVVGPGWQKEFIDVSFDPGDGNEEVFAIRAKNLKKVSEMPAAAPQASEMRRYGIRFGDAVMYNGVTKGVVLDEGTTSDTAMVKFSGVGTRSVQLVHCAKIVLDDETGLARIDLRRVERYRLRKFAAAAWAGVELTEAEKVVKLPPKPLRGPAGKKGPQFSVEPARYIQAPSFSKSKSARPKPAPLD